MLDTATKKRIDDCRDILVGKLPDPKAQIEQITIGLIYKFMDDMDKEAIELGGKAKFFSGGFKKYSWDNLFDSKVTASEMLKLYSEAIESMTKNPNIPQLFRDIFNNAYLPYRSPETLKLFLKTIGEFEYTHSEKLGDAFEYLLSVMGSQGDAGQFRTPRHIIDFLVAVVNPGKNDSILDPACGTAGFLISAFKHIKDANKKGLTPDERKKLIKNFVGYDISPDMVRLSRVNLYLHGFSEPHIYEYDTLSSEDRWKESFDVVLANPPFMSPKGGIRPHKKFSISSNRSEVLFVDYIAEHLNPKGRAGIIVPEGVIFQSGTAYKDLRKMLVDNYLYAVVSLPAGVFNPYSGVKTSILLMDKELAKKGKEVLFVKIDNDGYNLGAQRNAIRGGELEGAIETISKFRASIEENKKFKNTEITHAVAKAEIGKSGDYNLSGERYKTTITNNSNYSLVKIGEICEELFAGGDAPKNFSKIKTEEFTIPIFSNGIGEKSLYGYTDKSRVTKDAVTISARGTIGYPTVRKAPFFPIVRLIVAIPNKTKIEINYLKLALDSITIYRNGNSIPQLTIPMLRDEIIPLPPLALQQQIVSEIEAYQKIIDGAKMVVDNYKPKIEIDPEWEMVELGNLTTFVQGINTAVDKLHYVPTGIKVLQANNIYLGSVNYDKLKYITKEEYATINSKYKPTTDDVLYSNIGARFGYASILQNDEPATFSWNVLRLIIKDLSIIDKHYLSNVLNTDFLRLVVLSKSSTSTMPFISGKELKKIMIPLPPIETQQHIVAKIKREQSLIRANAELVEIFEQKIKEVINKVWQGKAKEYKVPKEELRMLNELK